MAKKSYNLSIKCRMPTIAMVQFNAKFVLQCFNAMLPIVSGLGLLLLSQSLGPKRILLTKKRTRPFLRPHDFTLSIRDTTVIMEAYQRGPYTLTQAELWHVSLLLVVEWFD